MFKKGFTLTEVLITMGLVGVVAAMTVPTLVIEHQDKANTAKLATTVAAVENAFSTMLVSEVQEEMRGTAYNQDPSFANLNKYLKLSQGIDNIDEFFTDGSGGELKCFNDGAGEFHYLIKNGVYMKFCQKDYGISEKTALENGGFITEAVGELIFDVNGKTNPNSWGKDRFAFLLANDGTLHPAGGVNYSLLHLGNLTARWNVEGEFQCLDARTKGCTSRVIEDNYTINY